MKTFLVASLWLLLPQDHTPDGFRVATPGHRFLFPADHGNHPEFRSEWWYYTGLLSSPEGGQYGFQLTFFRQALPKQPYRGTDHWRSDEIHLAHATLTDVSKGTFVFEERLQRGGLWARSAEGKLEVFNGPWRAEGDGSSQRLTFQVKGQRLSLTLQGETPPVIFGEDGVSRKGADPTAASHYVTFPRLRAEGTLARDAQRLPLTGQVWMDHEWSSNQLSSGQVGWDWAGIRLKDGRSWMAYRLRRADGSADPWSTLSEVDRSGRWSRSTRDWSMEGARTWTSPRSRAAYPLPMTLRAWGETFVLEPLVMDQELRTQRSNGITYWEGACRVRNAAGQDVGEAYLELTGYAGSLKGRF